MKNFILFLLCVVCCAWAFCAPNKNTSEKAVSSAPATNIDSLDWYALAAMALPKNCEGGLWADSAYNFSYGAKLRISAVELRYFNSCGKTSGADLWQIDDFDSYRKVFDKSRYSVALDFKKFDKRVDAKIALGSIGVSSRMKSPPLGTTLSPFVNAVGDAAAMSPALPTKSSAKKDDAFFAGAKLHFVENASTGTVRFLPLHFEFFCAKNEADGDKTPYVWTARGGFLYKNYLKVTNAFWFERYYAQSNATAAVDWWGEIPVWNSALFNSCMNETTVAIPYFKNKFIFGITENAQSLGRYWLRDEAIFKMGSFALNASAFVSVLNEELPLVTTAGSKKYSLWQLKLVPELCVFLQQGATLKFGAAGYLEEKILDYEKKNEHVSRDAKFATGIKYSGKINSFKLTGALSGVNIARRPEPVKESDLPKISGNVSCSHKFKNKNSIALSAAASFQPNRDSEKNEYIESFCIRFYPSAAAVKSVSLGATASQKKTTGNKFAPYAKASFLFKLKKVRINADICVNSNFAFSE